MVNKEENSDINAKAPSIYLKLAWIRKFNQAILGTSLCLFTSLIIVTAISYPTLIFWPDILLTIMFWVFLGFLFAYSFTDDPTKLIKPGLTLVGNILFILFIYFLAISHYVNLANVFPIVYVLSMVLFITLCIGGAITLVTNIYNLFFRHKYKKKIPKLFQIYQSGKIKKVLLIGFLLILIPFSIMAIPGIVQIPITIEPKDYQAEFAFWGGYGTLNSSLGEQLNKHKATAIFCCFPNVSEATQKLEFVTTITNYNNTYPNISIFLSVPGYPGAFVWDGNTQSVIEFAKTLVSVVHDNNLTIVKGLAFDIEGPYIQLVQGIDANPNRERHEESIELWYGFFDWMELNAPELELSAINYVESAVDTFDGDFDLHFIRRYSFLDLNTDALDEYAPMSYRCFYLGKKPYGASMGNPFVRYLDGGHYWVYTQMNLMAEALDIKFGNHTKMGVYLGITNCTCYSNGSVQYQNEHPAGYGYDNLVRDALIAKHFGVKRITLFLLTTVLENGYYMGGVFDSYGDDFLDRFNESVNGADSNEPFQIWYKPRFNLLLTHGHLDHFVYDRYSDLDSFIGIAYVSLLFLGNGLIAYYGWKKIKSKVLEKYNVPNMKFLNPK